MQELVLVKKLNKEQIPVTTSKLIAEESENSHDAVQKILSKFKEDFEEFGILFTDIISVNSKDKISKKGRKEKIYYLNELQATLLITYLKNTSVVRKFKIKLVKQFDTMRKLLAQKTTEEWQQTRIQSKSDNTKLTDAVKLFVEHAISQGSTNYKNYYTKFEQMINSAIGIADGTRDFATRRQLLNLEYVTDVVRRTIEEEVPKSTHYKVIYKLCKNKVLDFLSYFQPTLSLKEAH